MNKLFFVLFILVITKVSAQDIIQGAGNNISVVRLSEKKPTIRLHDGSAITLSYVANKGIFVTLSKNGKASDLCSPFPDASMVQVAESDIDHDGKLEILVGSRSADGNTIQILIYKKAEFETLYKIWTTLNGEQSIKFNGDGTATFISNSGQGMDYVIEKDGTYHPKS
jgi:hypothetical protein